MTKKTPSQEFSLAAAFPSTFPPEAFEELQADHMLAVLKQVRNLITEVDKASHKHGKYRALQSFLETKRNLMGMHDNADRPGVPEAPRSYLCVKEGLLSDDEKTILELRADKPIQNGRDGEGLGLYVANHEGVFKLAEEPFLYLPPGQLTFSGEQIGKLMSLVRERITPYLEAKYAAPAGGLKL